MERANPQDQYSFEATHSAAELQTLVELQEISEGTPVSVAGRMLSKRDQGSIVFGDIHDLDGSIQIVAEEGKTPEFDAFKESNIGDWFGITGEIGATRRGETSIFVNDWAKLAETEISFPGKQGLRDGETIHRQRYLDLAVNPESRKKFIDRSTIVSSIRRELEAQDFIEVETPSLQPIHGGASARPFETHHNALDMELYLRIAPELYLKRLVVGGLARVFEIGKVFRNEGISTKHNPEFTMMEVYAAYWDHENQMELAENLISSAANEVNGSTTIEYQGKEVDLSTPWRRAPMDQLVSEEIGEDVSVDTDIKKLRNLCEQHQIPVHKSYGTGKLLLELYEKTVESKLWGPIFVTEHPKEVSPLAREHRARPGYTERFEGIVAGMELCNGFSELNDPKEQYQRFLEQEKTKDIDDEAMPMDYDYIRALQYGLPPTAGLGIGIDRLVMLATNSASIRDIVLFPTLKPDGFKTSY